MSTTIESLSLEIISNSKNATNGLNSLIKTLEKLKKATSVGLGLEAVNSDITKLNTSLTKTSRSFGNMAMKVGIAGVSLKKISSLIKSAIKESNDYVENLNLFTVAMGNSADSAQEYAEKVGDLLGLDPSEWMRNQGVFMTLATGFGVAGDRAATMSEQLTQLGYDLSSFFNISVGDAMQKLQSGISGEIEPLRRLGYDLSQAKLEATAMALGIDKSVSSMTQAEKAQLRYYAIMTQVTSAQGDLRDTLDQPANQLRILTSEFTQAARAIGNIFIPALQTTLPYLIAAVKVVRILANQIASLVGYEMPEIDTSRVDSVGASTEESMENATKSAKKLKSYMMGFDELNVINPNSGSEDTDVASQFKFDLPTYDFLGDKTESAVNELVEKMKEWLGISGEINTWADLFDTKLGAILITVGAIGTAFSLWKIGAEVYSIITSIGGVLPGISAAISATGTALGAISAPVLIVAAAIAAVVAGLVAVYATNEEVRTSVNNAVMDIGESLKPLLEFITDTVLPNLKSAWDGLIEILTPFGEWLSMVFTSIWVDMIIPALEWISSTVIPKATEVFKNLWNKVLVPLGKLIGDILTPIIEKLSEVLTWLWQEVVVPVADCVGGVFAAVWENCAKIWNEVVIPRVNKVIEVFSFLWNKVLSPIVDFLWDVYSPAFKIAFETIGDVIGSIKKIFVGLINFVTGIFTKDWKQAWDGAVEIFGGIWSGLKALLKYPLNAALATIESFVNKIIDGWNWLKKGINSLSLEIPEWLGGGTLGFNLAMTKGVTLPRFADGGFPETGQMFIAREAGAEMVGNIGRKTAVANNDQIVAGIANGVAEANSEQNVLLREQNSLLRALLEKESGVYLDGRSLTNSVEKYQRERGRVLMTGGTY